MLCGMLRRTGAVRYDSDKRPQAHTRENKRLYGRHATFNDIQHNNTAVHNYRGGDLGDGEESGDCRVARKGEDD